MFKHFTERELNVLLMLMETNSHLKLGTVRINVDRVSQLDVYNIDWMWLDSIIPYIKNVDINVLNCY